MPASRGLDRRRHAPAGALLASPPAHRHRRSGRPGCAPVGCSTSNRCSPLIVDLSIQHLPADGAGGEDDVGDPVRVADTQRVRLGDVALDVPGAATRRLGVDQAGAEQLLADQAVGQGDGGELVAAVGVQHHLGGGVDRRGAAVGAPVAGELVRPLPDPAAKAPPQRGQGLLRGAGHPQILPEAGAVGAPWIWRQLFGDVARSRSSTSPYPVIADPNDALSPARTSRPADSYASAAGRSQAARSLPRWAASTRSGKPIRRITSSTVPRARPIATLGWAWKSTSMAAKPAV